MIPPGNIAVMISRLKQTFLLSPRTPNTCLDAFTAKNTWISSQCVACSAFPFTVLVCRFMCFFLAWRDFVIFRVRALDPCFMEHIRYKKLLWGTQNCSRNRSMHRERKTKAPKEVRSLPHVQCEPSSEVKVPTGTDRRDGERWWNEHWRAKWWWARPQSSTERSTADQQKVQPGFRFNILSKFETSFVILFPTPDKLAPVWPQCNPQCGYQDYTWLEQNSLDARDTVASMLITHFHRHHRAQAMIVSRIISAVGAFLENYLV